MKSLAAVVACGWSRHFLQNRAQTTSVAQTAGRMTTAAPPRCRIRPRTPTAYPPTASRRDSLVGNQGMMANNRHAPTCTAQAPSRGRVDAVMWAIEKDPLLRQTMTAVLLLDRPPDRQVLLGRMEHATRSLPPFRHRLVATPLRLSTPAGSSTPTSNTSYHVRWIRALGRRIDRRACSSSRASRPCPGFDQARPPWIVTVVEGLRDGQAAVIMNISHVVDRRRGQPRRSRRA